MRDTRNIRNIRSRRSRRSRCGSERAGFLSFLLRVVAHVPSPSLLVHHREERFGWCLSTADGLANLQENVLSVMNGVWRGLTVAAKVKVITVAALVANASDGLAASIAYHRRMSSLVDVDLGLTGERDMCKAMTTMLLFRFWKTLFAEVIVRTFKAFVANTPDGLFAHVATCRMLLLSRRRRRGLSRSGCVLSRFLDSLEGMTRWML